LKPWFYSKQGIAVLLLITVCLFLNIILITPLVDGKQGHEVLALQSKWDKQAAITMTQAWGTKGITYFTLFTLIDYLYAVSYALLFYCFITYIYKQKGINPDTYIRRLPLMMGALDGIENTLELGFVYHPNAFPDWLFITHTSISTGKWMLLPLILILLIQKFMLRSA